METGERAPEMAGGAERENFKGEDEDGALWKSQGYDTHNGLAEKATSRRIWERKTLQSRFHGSDPGFWTSTRGRGSKTLELLKMESLNSSLKAKF